MGRHKDPKLVKGLRMVANGSEEWAAFVASGKPTSWKNFKRAVKAQQAAGGACVSEASETLDEPPAPQTAPQTAPQRAARRAPAPSRMTRASGAAAEPAAGRVTEYLISSVLCCMVCASLGFRSHVIGTPFLKDYSSQTTRNCWILTATHHRA